MNIFNTMRELSNLTPNETILVDYIQQHPQAFLDAKPKELAAKIYVSIPTIYRLIDKLGLSGINDLKVHISSALNVKEDIHLENIDFPILPTDTHFEAMLRLKDVYDKTIHDTLSLADPQTLVTVSELMYHAKIIDVYASSANLFFAQNFQFQMQEINVSVNVPQADYMQRLTAASSDSTHVAIIISFGGRSFAFDDLMQTLKDNHVEMILITSTQDNPLCAYTDHRIYMSSFENHYQKISSFSTRMTLLYILDTLYAVYFKHDYEQNIKHKLATYQKMTQRLSLQSAAHKQKRED